MKRHVMIGLAHDVEIYNYNTGVSNGHQLQQGALRLSLAVAHTTLLTNVNTRVENMNS